MKHELSQEHGVDYLAYLRFVRIGERIYFDNEDGITHAQIARMCGVDEFRKIDGTMKPVVDDAGWIEREGEKISFNLTSTSCVRRQRGRFKEERQKTTEIARKILGSDKVN